MAAEDIENKVRKMSSQKPESGKDLQQFQEAQNQIVQINAERQGNLQTARLENNADAANNETMSQAVEMAALGGLGGGASVQQQVQSMNPQTQAVLGKYGLGQPKVQRTSSRSVQVTPQKITINNNTTNTTTNNVAVPAANIGGPVQGRTLAVKQNPDEGQARFKTWISNAFAKQNQQAAAREKEYQRREWSLTRSTNKLMKHLSDLGKSVSERLDPRKLASSVGGQFKTILFLFGTMFLAKHWKRIVKFAANVESFLFGEVNPADPGGKRGEPGFKKFFRDLWTGENGLGEWLVGAFGGKKGESIGEAFKKLFWNGESEKTGKGAGIFNILLKKIKDWFEEGALAAKSLEIPKGLLSKEPLDALQSLIEYFSGVISALFTGGKSLRKSIESSLDKKGEEALRSKDIGGRYRVNNDKKYHEILKDYQLESLGITDENIIASGVNRGDNAISADGKYSTHLMSNDLTKEGNLTGTVGSVIRQVNNIGILARDEDKMNLSGYTKGMRNLDEYMKEDSKKGEKATGLVLESTDSWRKLGVDPSLVTELRKSGHVKTKKFVNVVDKKTAEEMREELKHATSAEKEAAKEYANQYINNKIGVRKSIWKIVGGIAGAAGGLLLAPATGGTSLFISAAALGSAGLGGAWLGSKLAGGAHDVIMDERLQAAFKWAVTHDEIKEVRPYIIRTVPEDEVNNRPVVKGRIPMTKEVLDYEGWQRVKESQGMLTRDDSGNIVSERNYDLLNDKYWRENASHYYRNVAARQGIDLDDIPTETDIDDFNFEGDAELNELREQHRKEQEELEKYSRLNIAGNNIISSVKDYFSRVKSNGITGKASKNISKEESERNTKTAYDFFIKNGFTPEQASGMVGVLLAESGMNPGIVNETERAQGKSGYGRGIAQWSNERIGQFAKWHEKTYGEYKTPEESSLDAQLNYILKEMQERPAFMKAIKSTNDVREATDYMLRGFENGGPKSLTSIEGLDKTYLEKANRQNAYESMMKERIPYALAVYEKHGNGNPSSTQDSSTSDASETYLADNNSSTSTTPDNYVEQRTDKASSVLTYDWNSTGVNSLGSDSGLIMAQNSVLAPEKVTPNTPTSEKSIPGNTSESAGRELIADTEKDRTEDLYIKVSDINENIKLLSKTSIAQAEAINNVSTAIASLKFGGNINMGSGDGRTKVQSVTTPPYRG